MSAPTQLCQLAGNWSGAVPAGGLLIEEKVDGWRALYFRGHDGQARLWTRNGQRIEGVAHILHRLGEMERVAGVPMMFDGEFQVGGTLDATKRWCERGWKAGGEAGQFFAFDCMPEAEWRAGGTDRPLVERKAMLARLMAQAPADAWEWRAGSHGRDESLPPVILLNDGWAFGAGDVMREARRVWSAGGEGLVLKEAEAPYRRGRNAAWLKVKSNAQWRQRAA